MSSRFVYHFGKLGEASYYTLFVLVWMFALILTCALACRVFGLAARLRRFMCLTFVGSFIWYAQAASFQNVQYLGLVPNSVSYLSDVSAAIALLGLTDGWRGVWNSRLGLVVFAALTIVSAFAKEDMPVFLLATAIYGGVRLRMQGVARDEAVRFSAVAAGVICGSYALSFASAIRNASPFIGNMSGSGPYDLSNIWVNIPRNVWFYVTISPATILLVSGFAIAATVAALRPLRPFTAAIVFVFVSFFALMAPYLILPRHFDFYAMNFVPILAFSVAPVMMIACSERIRPAAVRTLVAWALIVAVMATLYWVDYRPRYNSLYWIRHIREMAKRQLDEVQRAGDLGLRACSSVRVTGATDLGPFLDGSAAYLTRGLGRRLRWTIVTEPGTRIDGWSRSRPFRDTNWRYVAGGEAGPPLPSECRLVFDPKTLRATFYPAQGAGS